MAETFKVVLRREGMEVGRDFGEGTMREEPGLSFCDYVLAASMCEDLWHQDADFQRIEDLLREAEAKSKASYEPFDVYNDAVMEGIVAAWKERHSK